MNPESQEAILARIDERLEGIEERMGGYVTQDQFWPVKTIVYSGAGIVLATVVGWLLFGVRQ